MLSLKRKSGRSGGVFSFRVSDVVDVPLRGLLLRLRVVEGAPSMSDLATGIKSFKKGMADDDTAEDPKTVEHRADETLNAAKEFVTKLQEKARRKPESIAGASSGMVTVNRVLTGGAYRSAEASIT